MNLRSRDPTDLVPRVEDIRALEREIVRRRREERQQAHLDRLEFVMDQHQNQPQDGEGNGQGADNLRPQHQHRQDRAIGTHDEPNIHGHRAGIRAPAVENNNFEIKSSLINMIQSNKYHGLALEDPLDHLDNFDKLCETTKIIGVSEDAFKLRTAKLRNEISGFHQKNLEGFGEAWERFNSYISQCPHHGFNIESLFSTFYTGALPKFRSQLDTASNEFFLGRSEADALELVENMAKSDSGYSVDHDRSNRGIGGDDQNTKRELKALQEKMDLLLYNKAKQEKVNFVGDHRQEELVMPFYNNQQGGYQARENYSQGFSSKGNQSTQGQAVSSTSAPQESSTDAMLKQILESQTRSEKNIGYELKNLHTKVDGSYNDLNNKFLQLSSHFKTLENQFASMPSTSKSPMGSLPGKSEQNPKEYCNVEAQIVEKVEHKIVERVEIQTVKKVEGKVLQPVRHKAEKTVIGKAVTQLKQVQLEEAHVVEQSPYDKLPFPQRFLTKAQKKVISKFRKDMGDVGVKLPQISNMHDAHVQMMLIKDILAHKEEVGELLNISTMQLDPPVTPKFIPKLETQGKFTLSCFLGKFTLDDALIGACTIPIDLTVLKMTTDKRVPLIFVTPFLTTVGACIDFANKKVTLFNVNKVVSYPIKSQIMNVDYCGTITCGEPSIEKIKDEMVVSEKEGLDGESSKDCYKGGGG
ncbi:uncharacterized protein LOC125582144 [Brassica napus]|uniref:uncharacterized protein LOC125582144 n=1 Tax=Brassica napus TaxID=3708 RepID=UPI00207884A7|nr:uncharacterized protein LOC125582144 [Brassica napus]